MENYMEGESEAKKKAKETVKRKAEKLKNWRKNRSLDKRKKGRLEKKITLGKL